MQIDIKRLDVNKSENKAGFRELVTIEFHGSKFASGVAHVDPNFACGYPSFVDDYIGAIGEMKAASNEVLGNCFIISRWRTPRSYVSNFMCQIEAYINGIWYTGRGGGSGLLWLGKRKTIQRLGKAKLPYWLLPSWHVMCI